jgi:uncharacterized membrane protein YraQ (UPF0718 family)
MSENEINLMRVVLFRTLQTLLESAPTLLCGLLIAGVIRGMIAPDAVRRWFTEDARIGPVRAWLTGILLPVCSFGVLPVAWELRRAGVPRATVLTFLLAAPLADPFSLTYAFQKMENQGAFGIALYALLLIVSFVIPVGMGVLLGRWLPEAASPSNAAALPASGLRRAGLAVLAAARGSTGILPAIVVIGSFGSGLLALIPGGALERVANDRSWGAPLHTALVSLPLQIPPGRGTVLLCEMLLNGGTAGTACVFLLLGMGLNFGTLIWIARSYGYRLLVSVTTTVFVAALALGYAFPVSLPNAPSEKPQNHFLEIEAGGSAKTARLRLLHTTVTNATGERQWFLIGACGAICGLALAGVVARGLGERGTIAHWMTRPAGGATAATSAAWNKPLSAPQLALAGLAVILATAVAGLYVYYPAPADLLDEMDSVYVELVLALKSDPVSRENALRLTAQWQRLERKLAVADLLRRGRFDARLKMSSEELRAAIHQLRAALVDGDSSAELDALCTEAHQAASRCRDALDGNRAP